MMLAQDEVTRIALETEVMYLVVNGECDLEELQAFAQACYEAGVKAENEACAITAWNHYADECKRSGLNAHHFGDWCAATTIRKRRKLA